jgi:uncharacterized Zn-binding protein involved in type VI secretion
MATPEQIKAYYTGYPDPDNPRTWGVRPSGVRVRDFATAQAVFEAAHGAAPQPSPVPGPASPGSGMAAARAGDTTAHGGTIGPVTTGQAARVHIGHKPAACMGDPHVCPMFSGPKPHTGGTITKGSSTVFIGGKPVARVADLTVCTSEPGQVAAGELTVLIGDQPGGAASPAPPATGAAASSDAEADRGADESAAPAPSSESSSAARSRRRDAQRERRRRRPGDSQRDVGAGTHWVSIELVDEAGQPIVGERYRITLPDGREIAGGLDSAGRVRINGVQKPGACQIAFPRLDKDAWSRYLVGSPATAVPDAPPLGATQAPVQPGAAAPGGIWRRAARGACVSSIAFEAGHFWQTLWEHGANANLRRERGNPNVLRTGDAVFVPEPRPKSEWGDTDRNHQFTRRGEPAQLPLRVLADGEPRANQPWTLEIDGRRFEGQTDADGALCVPMIGNARRAMLRVGPPGDEDEYELDLGTVEPISCEEGVRARLENLGYFERGRSESADDLADALRAFQSKRGLAGAGVADEATRARLLAEHGS